MSYKVLRHPDRDLIIQWLGEGRSVRDVEKLIAERYSKPNQAKLRIGSATLNDFRKNYLNVEGKVSRDVQEVAARTLFKQQEREKELARKSPAYQELLKEAAAKEIDVTNEILKVFTVIEARIEDLYNELTSGGRTDNEKERVFQTYLGQFMKVLEQHKKYVEGYKEQVDVNVNVTVMSEQIAIMREAIREILGEVDPTLIPIFMEKLNSKMKTLSLRNSDTSIGHSAILDTVLDGDIA